MSLISEAEAEARREAEELSASALYLACQGCDVEGVQRQLIDGIADIDQPQANGVTPLVIACVQAADLLQRDAAADCVRLLLAAKAAVNQRDPNGDTPLLIASAHDARSCVEHLLAANATVDQPYNTCGMLPLMVACGRGFCSCVEALLAAHAAVNLASEDGRSALHIACGEGNPDCARLLLAAKASIDQVVSSGRQGDRTRSLGATPLCIACWEDRKECVQLLLHSNAAVNQGEVNGATPLFLSCAVRAAPFDLTPSALPLVMQRPQEFDLLLAARRTGMRTASARRERSRRPGAPRRRDASVHRLRHGPSGMWASAAGSARLPRPAESLGRAPAVGGGGAGPRR
eukprot:5945886-Prymnesium_polylepis.1